MLYAGFEGRYTNKAGKTAEGSATFFRKDHYRAVALKEMKMNELFANILADPSAHAIHAQFLPLLQSSPTLVQALSRVRLQPCFLSAEMHDHLCAWAYRMMDPWQSHVLCTAFLSSACEARQVSWCHEMSLPQLYARAVCTIDWSAECR